MDLPGWVALGLGSGFAFRIFANRLGLWDWTVRHWNQNNPASSANYLAPILLKFSRVTSTEATRLSMTKPYP